MPGQSNNYYGREANVTNLNLPAFIKCERCFKKKDPRNYAKKRQNDAKEKMSRGQEPTAICMCCTGNPVLELECFVCDMWKTHTEFSKAQRKNPDHARCEKCMLDQTETEPIETGGTHGYDDDSEDEDGAGAYMPAPTGTHDGKTEGLSVDLLGLWISDEKQGNGVKQSEPAGPAGLAVKSPGGQSAVGGAPLTYGFDPKAYSSRASSTTNSMAANPPASKNANFAKVPAYKPPKPKKEEKKDFDNEVDWQSEQEDDEPLDEDEI